MREHREKKVILVFLFIVLLAPILILVWNPKLGGIIVLVSLLIAYSALRLLRNIQGRGSLENDVQRHDRGTTIYVQLVDDAGNPLDPAIAQARLAQARAKAGPRDTVIGVNRIV